MARQVKSDCAGARSSKIQNEHSCWIFQGNPKVFDARRDVNDNDQVFWKVNNQYVNKIKTGDKVYLWVAGKDSGIIASGEILSDPEFVPIEQCLHAKIVIKRKFLNKIVPRSVLAEDQRTKRMSIITFGNASNFPVNMEQEEVIESIIAGKYIPLR